MVKDTIKTKLWKDKIKVWFAETYWRPEDCIENKDSKDFYKKFNPTITTDIKIFSVTQVLFTTTVFNLVFINAPLLSYFEICLFGVSLVTLASLTGFLMHGKKIAYQLILLFSMLSILVIYTYSPINMSLISSKLLLAQLGCNVITVTGILLFQLLFNMRTLKA